MEVGRSCQWLLCLPAGVFPKHSEKMARPLDLEKSIRE